MTQFLCGKRVLLGVTGSIAAYKSPDLVRRLREAGAIVRVVMTNNAKAFITPLTMQAVSGFPVHDQLFDLNAEAAMGHIELARWADVIVVAPATADFMARLAQGMADDLLTTLCLATAARVVIAPAMNQGMYKHTLTQRNLQDLQQRGTIILATNQGSQACGDVGYGRMLEPVEIVEKVSDVFATQSLAGIRLLITAGPTHEAIDPVRFISNGSSGKMGYALAQAAVEAGAEVTMVSGPVSLAPPAQVNCYKVVSAQEMNDLVMKKISECDIFLSVAAVSDYRCQTISEQKIHKNQEVEVLQLERNPDIVANVARMENKPFVVGFAAETENVLAQARAKRERKGMNMIVANHVGFGVGMGSDDSNVTIITAKEEKTLLPAHKSVLARQLIAIIADEYKRKTS